VARKKRISTNSVAARLVGGKPLALKLHADGSLVVIRPDGRKAHFDAAQVRAAGQAEDDGSAPPIKQAAS